MGRGKVGKAVLGTVGVLALATAGAYAAGAGDTGDGPGGRHGRHGWGGRMGIMRGLNLTDEQRASFKEIVEEHRKAQEPLRKQHQELRAQIRQQLESGNADAATIGQLTIQAHALGKQLHESRAALKDRFEALLTPEQKAKLEERKSQREKRSFGKPGKAGAQPRTEL
jgi:periplasmic protein CpxP/Spy